MAQALALLGNMAALGWLLAGYCLGLRLSNGAPICANLNPYRRIYAGTQAKAQACIGMQGHRHFGQLPERLRGARTA